MKSSFLTKIFLLAFFIFSLYLHFYQLGSAPKAVLVDGAALGYNAYSISVTGKDEFGTSYPLLFKSFGDQKLPLYIYASVIPVKLFGLSVFSSRFVAALSASLLVFVMFFILRSLAFDESASLIGAGITTVSSWTIILGRFSWESSLGLLLFSLSLLFLLQSIKSNKTRYFILGAFFLGLTWYSYIPYRIIALLTFFLFFVVAKTNIHKKLMYILIFIIIIAPSIPSLISPTGSARFKQTTILYDQANTLFVNDRRVFCNEYSQQLLCSLLINKPIEISFAALQTLTRVLSVSYLFISGASDGQLINVGYFALIPIFMAPFYLLGYIQLYIKRKELKSKRQIIFLGLTFAACFLPILVTKSPVRIQMSSLFPFITIIIVYGYTFFISMVKSTKWQYVLYILFYIYGFLFIFYFINVHAWRDYGNEKFIIDSSLYLAKQYTHVDGIYVDPAFSDFLISYAFYNKIDPTYYQKNIKEGPVDANGFQHTVALGKIILYHEDYPKLGCQAKAAGKKYLLLTNQDLSKNITNLKPIFTGQEKDQLIYGYVYNLADLCR